jgi:MFS family permease
MVLPDVAAIPAIRRRSHVVLIAGQALAGIGMGATVSAGALLASQVSGSPAWSGMAATMSTLGTALAALPLAALARRLGRSPALATGAVAAVLGAVVGLVGTALSSFPLLLVGLALLGVGMAVNLQSRFAATDLSEPDRRGRDLAIVVWATTIGAVAGPNLIGPADSLGLALGLPTLAGVFLFTIAAQILAAALYFFALRPDPLRVAQALGAADETAGVAVPTGEDRAGVRTGILATSFANATMVSVMAMTPVHLVEHGATLPVVGLTLSLHVAGMFGLSPVFGWLSDRIGREPVIALGQGLFLAALLMTSLGAENTGWVLAGLISLGLGWSAASVAGSALVAESAGIERRTVVQGRSDLFMSLAGAVGGAASGPVLAGLGYSGLSFVAMALAVAVLVVVGLRAPATRRFRPAEPVPPAE